ncbi:acyltransferase [Clostridium perfringens]|uniref:acyltransferase n=1 Tax=Clostridium perfringens TaxID=1502 RepID=UPI0009919CCA|nr:hypothetical protein [Clostridium perfringens]AQW22831.1 hypothetical protein BXT91_02570 [Clostridium perfringens]MBI6105660.1 hypothetical protein [Clostridium perfringens]MBO3322737.1 hypothetical protein [Clostridium perfringens]MBO3331854.1 hypothetical protein [Clostridium perfringens]MBO3411015.1 hypothetical protein [Clostridium perfringens]
MSERISNILNNLPELFLSIPKSVYFNFKVLPFKEAIKMPFVISYRCKIKGINKRNFIVNSSELKFAQSRIGIGGSHIDRGEKNKSLLKIIGNGKIIINGKVGFSKGIVLYSNNGIITLGDNIRTNFSTTISCEGGQVSIGNEVTMGWHVTIKNSDGHWVTENGENKEKFGDITIGNHSWICSHVDILKNVVIGNDNVVAYRSLVVHGNGENNVLIAGSPAKIIRTNINWIE